MLRTLPVRDAADGGDDHLVADGRFNRGGEICMEALALRRECLLQVVACRRHIEDVDAVVSEKMR